MICKCTNLVMIVLLSIISWNFRVDSSIFRATSVTRATRATRATRSIRANSVARANRTTRAIRVVRRNKLMSILMAIELCNLIAFAKWWSTYFSNSIKHVVNIVFLVSVRVLSLCNLCFCFYCSSSFLLKFVVANQLHYLCSNLYQIKGLIQHKKKSWFVKLRLDGVLTVSRHAARLSHLICHPRTSQQNSYKTNKTCKACQPT